MIKKLFKAILFLAALYCVVVLVMFAAQRRLLYYPDRSEANIRDSGIYGMEEIEAITQDGLRLTGWFKKPASYAMPVIVWFHGNGGKHSDREPFVEHYVAAGYGILLASYRGYAGQQGELSEQNLYKDARAFIRTVQKRGYRVVVYGESLGSGIAVQMAKENADIRAVILHSPYTSTVDVARSAYPFLPVGALMKDRYENSKKIGKIYAPILIMHGATDQLIPVAHAKKLYELANNPKRLKIFPKGNHVDLYSHGAMATVMRFLEYDVMKRPAMQ